MERTLIKLDGKVFELGKSAKGKVTIRQVGEDELFDTQVLEGTFEQHLQNDFNLIAGEAYKQTLDQMRHGLKKTILSTLGFEDDYGRGWRVDHCNGRMSDLTHFLSDKVKSAFREEADKAVEACKAAVFKEAEAAMKKGFRDAFMEEVRHEIRGQAQKAAHDFMATWIQTEIKKLEPEAVARAKAAILGKPQPTEFEVPVDFDT